jgi:hypothetical protein
VGSVIERMRMQILEDKSLRKRIAELEKKLIKYCVPGITELD